ncbi:hypothetical protein FGO68_gene12379 [Halteria grandinella]|uniref:Uncharacterized protein n=1 Tax=Halteria grandinella TaxID=5974 RepID=A0A8J8T0T3_HALGN|nr:hypothetical protein FGO68_gene12379 [Halteria grandinella]
MKSVLLFASLLAISFTQNITLEVNSEPTFLLASDGQSDIYYGPIKQYLKSAANNSLERFVDVNELKELVVNLKFKPTAMEYCYMSQILYVCMGESSGDGENDGFIAAFKLKNEDGKTLTVKTAPDVYTIRPVHKDKEVYMRCNGKAGGSSMKLDKFGNLIFLARDGQGIMKIPHHDLDLVFNLPPRPQLSNLRINVTCEDVYTSDSTQYATDIQGITIEREYLYWTNNLTGSDANHTSAVAKAFVEPFIKQIPLQTFQVTSDIGAGAVSANSAFLFFQIGETIQGINKHGYTSLYFNLGIPMNNLTSIVTYRDDLIFTIENGALTYLDVSHLSFNVQNPQQPVSVVKKGMIFNMLPNGMKIDSIVVAAKEQGHAVSAFIEENNGMIVKASIFLSAAVLLICNYLI